MNVRVVVAGLLMAVVYSTAGLAQPAKPLDEPGLVALLGLGLDDEAVVARIKKGPLALEASDAFLERLQTAGASEAVIRAVRAAAASKPAVAGAVPVTYQQVLQMLSLGLDEEAILRRLAKYSRRGNASSKLLRWCPTNRRNCDSSAAAAKSRRRTARMAPRRGGHSPPNASSYRTKPRSASRR